MKQILGQQGDKSIAKKLYAWLINWHKNQSGQVKHIKPSKFFILYIKYILITYNLYI